MLQLFWSLVCKVWTKWEHNRECGWEKNLEFAQTGYSERTKLQDHNDETEALRGKRKNLFLQED